MKCIMKHEMKWITNQSRVFLYNIRYRALISSLLLLSYKIHKTIYTTEMIDKWAFFWPKQVFPIFSIFIIDFRHSYACSQAWLRRDCAMNLTLIAESDEVNYIFIAYKKKSIMYIFLHCSTLVQRTHHISFLALKSSLHSELNKLLTKWRRGLSE